MTTYNSVAVPDIDDAILVHQRRTAQDFPYYDWIERIIRPEGTQDYFFVSEVFEAFSPIFQQGNCHHDLDEKGALCGKVYVVPFQKIKRLNELKKKRVNELRNLIKDTHKSSAIIEPFLAAVSHARSEGIKILEVNFALFRTGEVRVWFEMDQFIARTLHKQTPEPGEFERRAAAILPAQIYYFIKDITHQHYHHHPTSDQLLPLVRLDEDTHDKNETKWRRETLWGLARVVSQFRRHNRLSEHKKAMGVLAYTEVFQKGLGRIIRAVNMETAPKYSQSLTDYDFTHTKQSVDALDKIDTWKTTGKLQAIIALSATFFSTSALWIGSVNAEIGKCRLELAKNNGATCQDKIISDPFSFIGSLADNPVPYFIGPMLLIYMLLSMTSGDWIGQRFIQQGTGFVTKLTTAWGTSVTRKSNSGFGIAASHLLPALLILGGSLGATILFSQLIGNPVSPTEIFWSIIKSFISLIS